MMQPQWPALAAIYSDDHLTDFDRRVLMQVAPHLNFVDYSDLKIDLVMSCARCSRTAAIGALKKLVEAGYLHRDAATEGVHPGRKAGRYRLRFNVLNPPAIPTLMRPEALGS